MFSGSFNNDNGTALQHETVADIVEKGWQIEEDGPGAHKRRYTIVQKFGVSEILKNVSQFQQKC